MHTLRTASLPAELHRVILLSRSSLSLRRSFSSSRARLFNLLALESSADDSCAAILTSNDDYSDPRIASNIVLRQPEQERFGGIEPLSAIKAHLKNVPMAIRAALTEAKLDMKDIGAVAYTRGPGMFGCLNACGVAAKTMAAAHELPLLGVHHMQAHALTPLLTEETPPSFPFLTLLLSGGHTLLVLARSESSFKILATTHDESIGRSFDKVCRALKLPWSLGNGSPGAALEAFCSFDLSPSNSAPNLSSSNPFKIPFKGELAFSYSGLRSEFDRMLKEEGNVDEMEVERKRQLARWFGEAAVSQIEDKVELALEKLGRDGEGKLGGLVMSGGVASNQFLRWRIRRKLDDLDRADLPLVFPPPYLCTDNAAMIGMVGLSRLRRSRIDDLGKESLAKWSIEKCEEDFET